MDSLMARWDVAVQRHLLDPFRRRLPSAQVLVSANAQQMAKLWEERSPQFFFDLLTSRWRIVDLLEQLAALWPGPVRERQRLPWQPAPHARSVLFLGGGDTTYQSRGLRSSNAFNYLELLQIHTITPMYVYITYMHMYIYIIYTYMNTYNFKPV